ncbi:hypothetical protein PFICI_07006 [Pestalotiopsis fici W106-1]|uniref:DUF7721 domain-containing protein n=1 Tax=Pestalotiopsis fici (strain W106-1 / CGMCC3.15140) TaxID=1229662 RepID=W3X7J8_PESFW|nr:uncharacterized protein PFICI_07006 [Pestalotiopsis fici W106-1]ETS82004.1 hypothetical protein PFICI_07006 [Pestalotiopsis fici W106-1]
MPALFGGEAHGGSYPAGGYGQEDDDLRGAAEHASRHAGDSGDSSLFSTLLGALNEKRGNLAQEDVDEDDAVQQHKRFFGGNDDDEKATSSGMGSAAAMQALKMFSGGSAGNSESANSQSAFIGLAMAEASKLFDQKANEGKVSGEASKESAVMQAGEMALKFYMKSKGGDSSSSSGLMSLASKFM